LFNRVDPEAGCPNYFEKDKAFKYMRIPVFDNVGEDILTVMPSAIEFIDVAKHYGSVLVHCNKVMCNNIEGNTCFIFIKTTPGN
jgi:hypothetical protein